MWNQAETKFCGKESLKLTCLKVYPASKQIENINKEVEST